MRPPLEGVYPVRSPGSWPLRRPRAMLDIFPQLLDQLLPRRAVPARPELRQALAELHRDGATVIDRVAPQHLIEQGVLDMERFAQVLPELEGTMRTKRRSTGGSVSYQVHEFQRDLNIYRSHDPLVFSAAYAKFLLLPELRDVAACYLGRNWLYQAMIATRTEACEPMRKGFARWHHDARGRKLNIIMPLMDVPPDGPATVVLTGSHRLMYLHTRRTRNVFSDEEVRALKQRYGWTERVCHAPAGSLVLFDSNALHLGRRSPHRRDAFQVNCMTKRDHLWPHEVPERLLAALTPAEQRMLLERANLSVI